MLSVLRTTRRVAMRNKHAVAASIFPMMVVVAVAVAVVLVCRSVCVCVYVCVCV